MIDVWYLILLSILKKPVEIRIPLQHYFKFIFRSRRECQYEINLNIRHSRRT